LAFHARNGIRKLHQPAATGAEGLLRWALDEVHAAILCESWTTRGDLAHRALLKLRESSAPTDVYVFFLGRAAVPAKRQYEPMDIREHTARQIAGEIDAMITRANTLGLETLVYVLETARIEALRATRPQQERSSSQRG
jgi:hypothetical protein